jgi:hypothetical protein
MLSGVDSWALTAVLIEAGAPFDAAAIYMNL